MAIQKLTPEQWLEVRRIWQADSRDGYAWLVRELDLGISAPAVRKTALKQGWQKRGNSETQKPAEKPKSPSEKPKRRNQKPTEKPSGEMDDQEVARDYTEVDANDDRVRGDDEGSNSDFSDARACAHANIRSRDPALHDFEYGRGLVRLLGRSRRGRSLYDPEFAVAGYQMALLGAPMANLAELIGV
ncbi:MAG: hypothetical protein ACRCT2_02260, partial [Plesiomonas shigelloides]